MWDCVNLKWDAAGKANTLCWLSLISKRLKETLADGGYGRESSTMSDVNKALVESWVVGAAVRKVSITKQTDWTILH